jgi:toxin ParE1/3/4
MPTIDYSDRAREDIRLIYEYIAEDSVTAADAAFDRIFKSIKMLTKNPRAGRRRLEYGPDVRTITVHPFVVFYRLREARGDVQVLRILDGRRDLGTVFFSPLIAA